MANAFPLGYDIAIKTLDQQYGLASETRPDRTEDIVAATGEEITTSDAKAKVTASGSDQFYKIFQRGYQLNKSVDELTAEAADVGLKSNDFTSNPDFILEQALTVNDLNYSSVDARITSNMQTAQEMISSRLFETGANKGTFGKALDVADRFLRAVSPIGVYEDITGNTEAQSREILTAAATMAPDMFRQWFDTRITETTQEGIFREENIAALEELQGRVAGAGYDPNKGFNQILSAFDLIGAGELISIGAKAAVKSSIKSTTSVGRVAAIRGSEAASDSAEAILKVSPDPEVLGNVSPSTLDLQPQAVRPSVSKFTEKFAESEIIKGIDDLYQKGAFGRVAEPGAIKASAKSIAEGYKKKISRPLFDYKVVDEGLGNFVTVTRFGKATDGTPFKPMSDGSIPRGVQKLADDISEKVDIAEVAPVDANDLTKGYVVQVSERINTSGLQSAIDEVTGIRPTLVRNTLGKIMNNEIMGSAALRDNQRLSTLSQMAESSRAAVKTLLDPYTKSLQKLNPKERYTLQAVYTELRDGVDSNLRVRYTEGEFAAKYQQIHPNGELFSEKALDAYNSLAAIEEADYLLKTSNMLNRYIEKGYKNAVQVRENYFAPAKVVRRADVPDDAKILDGQYGGKIRKQDIEGENYPIWKLDKPTNDGQEFVVTPANVRMIDATDVMGYNPGGSRANPNLNYFITLGDKRLKALLGTFSEKQAKTAVDQLRNIQRAVRDNSSEIDDIIRANNDWNPSIQDFEDFKKVAGEEGWDFNRGEINYRGRNDDILSSDVENSDVFSGMKINDYVSNDLRRNDRVLMDFGGGRAYNEDPVNSVLAQMGNSIFTYSNRAYARNAMVGWVKKAQQKGRNWFPEGVSPNDYETLFRSAELRGTDEFSRRMAELRDITMRRLNMKDESSQFMERQGQAIAEFVFDKTGKQLSLGDPSNILLKIGFQSAFGFANASQFFMQAFHATTVMAISPIHGLKGAAMTIPLRGALRAVEPAAKKLSIERLAKASGLSVKDTEEWVEFIRTSGRAVIDGDAIEDGTGVGFGISGWNGESMKYSTLSGASYNVSKLLGKGLDLGLMPFKAGERMGRLTAINTAFLEFKAANKGVSALSDQARLWITRREQDLTFNMNSLSRGKVQAGLMKVPTQWLSYTLRSMESVFVGRNFTAAERARLFVALVPMYGLTGFGLANSADFIAEKVGIAPDSNLYIGLKYGMLDALVAELSPVEISLGQRLAPVGAITDTYKKIFEDKTITALGGPSGEITGGVLAAASDAIWSLIHGQTATLTEDALKVLRQPSGLDNVAKAIGIWNNGVYRSKNGIALDSEMSVGDGIVALTGFTPLEVTENYSRLGQIYTSGKQFSDFRKEVNRDAELIFDLMKGDTEDVDKALQLMKELHERISFSGFPSSQMASLRRAARTELETNWSKIQTNLIEQDRLFALQAARSILQGSQE